MHQQGNKEFITLNSLHIGNLFDDHTRMLQSRWTSIEILSNDANVFFAENYPKDQHNGAKLETLQEQVVEIPSIDKVLSEIIDNILSSIENRPVNQTGNVASKLRLKRHCRVMLRTNVDISDRLINGQLGPIYDFPTNIATVTKIYIKLDDNTAGLKAIQNTSLARTNNYDLISRTEASLALSKIHTSTIKRTQFPIMLVYAYTIHEGPCLTLKKICLSFDLSKQKHLVMVKCMLHLVE